MTQSCPGRLMSPGGLAIQAPVLQGFSTKGDLALVDLGEDTNPGTLLCSLRLGGSPRHGAPGPTPRLPSTSLHPAGQPSSLCCPRLSPKQPFIDHQIISGSAGGEFVCNAGDLSSIPGLGRSPGEGKGSPLQCLAWRIPWTV